MVGKWHLGFCKEAFTPTKRGFDSFVGYYTGAETYFNHERGGYLDFRRNTSVDYSARGTYSTDLMTRGAVKIVRNHNTRDGPMFLYLPYQAVHAPLQAPRDEFTKIKRSSNSARGIYRAMLSRLDQGVKQVVAELKRAEMWNNTILVFSTDNGGAVSQAGSNHPLREDSSSNLTFSCESQQIQLLQQVQACLSLHKQHCL